MVVIKKRNAEEWMRDDNLLILRGVALQCLTYQDVADSVGVSIATLDIWRKKYPEIAEAIEIGRSEADCIILAVSFDDAVRGDQMAKERWWRYRIGPKEAAEKPETVETEWFK